MENNSLAPICLFVYKRLSSLIGTINSLLQNDLAKFSNLHIFSDAAANSADEEKVILVREYIRNIIGFKSVSVYYAEKNRGLAPSIIKGVSNIISKTGKVIVLEDDLIVSDNFIDYMNQALTVYQFNPQVFTVSGYSSPIIQNEDTDVYFTKRASSWGWASWKNRWEVIDWTVPDYKQFILDKQMQREFNKMGSDLSTMLKRQMEGRISSWAIRWVYHQFKNELYSVYPLVSKVSNEGFNSNATNTYKNNAARFATTLDTSGNKQFHFLPQPYLNKEIIKQFISPYSVRTRALFKIKELLSI